MFSLLFNLDWYCPGAVFVSNTIQLCTSDNKERKAWAPLTFPKYPASGEAKAPKPVSSPVIGKQLLVSGSKAVRCHSKNITISLQRRSPPEGLRGGKYSTTEATLKIYADKQKTLSFSFGSQAKAVIRQDKTFQFPGGHLPKGLI